MRVAIITDTFMPQINGVTKTLKRLKEHFDQRDDIEYRFFVPDYCMKEEMASTVSFKSLKLFLYPECQIAFPNYLLFKKQLDAFKPDILHIKTQATMGLMGLKYGETNNIPMVSTYTTNLSAYLKAYKLSFVEKPLWLYLKHFHDRCDINLVPSSHSKEQLNEKNIKNLKVWRRGVDLKAFNPSFKDLKLIEQLKDHPKETLLLHVGRLAKEKNLDLLMEMAIKMNNRGMPFKLIIVGDGPYRRALEAKNIDNVIFTGFKKGKELAAYYASCDIFLFPSTTETFGNVILEAMASKTPVISVYEGGVKENIVAPYNALTVNSVTGHGFYEQVRALIKSPDSQRLLAENAFHYAKKKSWGPISHELILTYESLMNKNDALIHQVG